MRPAKAMLTDGTPVRVVMTMAMAMMSVRRKAYNKSDVWVY